jgi:hypothetical protein
VATPTAFRSGIPRDYSAADAYLGPKADRPIANNTRLQRRDGGDIAVRLHETDVVTFHPDNSRTLNSGGWRTPTTKDRINGFGLGGGVTLWQSRGRWTLQRRIGGEWQPLGEFRDGIRLTAEGEIANPEPYSVVAARDRRIALRLGKIRAYVRAYMKEFRAGMPAPSGGDCWLCLFREVGTGTPWGDIRPDDHAHLESHLKERYYVPALAWNAVAERGYPYPEIILGLSADGTRIGGTRVTPWNPAEPNGHPDMVSRALTRYLKRRLVPEVAR